MAVAGILQGNAAIYNPYQQNRAYNNKGAVEGFGDTYHSKEAASVQAAAAMPVNKDIDPLKVDPRNASFEEIQAYNNYLVEKGYLKIEDIGSFEHPVKDDKEKADYYTALKDWADLQVSIGNMEGYRKAARMREAWTNDIEDKEGTVTYFNGVRAWIKEEGVYSTPPLLGFGGTDDGMSFDAIYADDSTPENPVIEVRMRDKDGGVKTVKVNVNQVDPTNATQLEMLALLCHQDKQGSAGGALMQSYHDLIYRAQNSTKGDMSAKNMQDFMSWRQNWRDLAMASSEYSMPVEEAMKQARAAMNNGAPYSYLAKDGIIDYNGVIFVCDTENNALRLGDTSNPKNCITVNLSNGGSLIVNRDNLGSLAKAIGMFSPEDVNLILRAIAEDAKVQQMKQQIDDETSGLDIAEDTGEQETDEEVSEIPLAESLTGKDQTEEKDKK